MSNNIDVVIITALDKERDAVQRYLDKFQQIESNIFNLPHTNTDSFYQVTLLCVGNMGSVEAGVATTRWIAEFNPSIIILTGIMGGVKGDKRNLGDLIVADQIVNYEQGKITDINIERRYEVHRPDNELLEATRNSVLTISPTITCPDSQNTVPNIHWGLIVSGEKVIADNETIPNLQNSWPKMIGVEMESYGAALSVYKAKSRPRFLMVKSICDWANSEKNDDWQEYAADVAAKYVVNFLKTKPIDIKPDKPIKQTKPFPEILFYSPDRVLQKDGFKKIIKTYQEQYSDKKQRPILFLIHGDEKEYGDFINYLLTDFLPNDKFLAKYFNNGTYKIPLLFHDNFQTVDKLHQEIVNALERKTDRNKKEAIAKQLAKERQPVIAYGSLLTDDLNNWQGGQKTIIDSFIEFWADWPKKIYAQNQFFLVFLSIGYKDKKYSVFHKLLSRKNTNKILVNQLENLNKDYPTIIEFFGEKNVHAKVLPMLNSITRQQACNWVREREELKFFCDDTYFLENKIKKLYEKKNPIPMDELVVELKKLLNIPKY